MPPNQMQSQPAVVSPQVNLFRYTADELITRQLTPEDLNSFNIDHGTLWINVEGTQETETIHKIITIFNLHPLIAEDILQLSGNPLAEIYDDVLFIVVRMLSLDPAANELITEHVSFVLGENFLLTFQEGIEGDVFDPVRERLARNKGNIRSAGADYLCYELLEAIVNSYFSIVDTVGDSIEQIEDTILEKTNDDMMKNLHQLRGDLLTVRKAVSPLRDILSRVRFEKAVIIRDETQLYFKDLYNHILFVVENIESYREMITGLQDLYLSSISNRLNQVMKVLTIITTIFIPLSFVAGVYGMNFKNMPELEWWYGYPLILTLMFTIAVVMIIAFKVKKWF
jgi:magnesium transporter